MLPEEYQEVEYLKATGTQYIATDYVPTKDDEIYTKIIPDASPTAGSCVFSAGTGTYQTIVLLDKAHNIIYYKYFASGVASNSTFILSHSEWNTIKTSSAGYFVVGPPDRSWVVSSTYQNELDGTQTTLYLLRRRNDQNPFYGKMKKFSISRNGELKLYLIPCFRKSDNKTGVYDVVSMHFYPNAGNGEFELGPEVLPWKNGTRHKRFWRQRKELIKPYAVNVAPLHDVEKLDMISSLNAKISRKRGLIHVEGVTATANPHGYDYIIFPTANTDMPWQANYAENVQINENTSFLIHPGTYRLAVTAKTNIAARVYLGTGALGNGVTQRARLDDGETHAVTITAATEILLCIVIGFCPTSFPVALDADIKLSLIKIG